jgi:hypothetical protein
MNKEPVHFGSLDPRSDPDRFERVVRAIVETAGPELSLRRARASVFSQLSAWRRPLLAAAAIAGIVSLGTLSQVEAPASVTEDEVGVAEAVGVPQTIASWVRSGETPSTAELLLELELEE